MAKPKNLPHPITTTIAGVPMTFVTIGHCARELHRTTTCLKQWEKMGLFPSAEYRTRNQRRLYPIDFVRALARINQAYVGRRMDRNKWKAFQMAVWAAHEAALAPLRAGTCCVVEGRADGETEGGAQG